jgi:hypothetical protein
MRQNFEVISNKFNADTSVLKLCPIHTAKQETSVKAGGLFFGHEDGGDMFLQKSTDFQWNTWRYTPED